MILQVSRSPCRIDAILSRANREQHLD